MVIEWLRFQVPADQREQFIRLDDGILTAALKDYPGFISKETWTIPNDDEAVIFVIRWRTREEWKAVPEKDFAEIEAQFKAALDFEYTMTELREFQVGVAAWKQ